MFLNLGPLRKHRDYRLLYTGQLVSMFGSMITYVAVPYQVFELTHSSFVVGMLGAAQLVPLLLFALWGGAYADALDRRKLLIVSEIVMAGGSLALAINGMLAHASVTLIFAVSATMSACNGFHRPALDAMTPRLVDREDLTAVSALNFFRFSISSIGGPALGGVCMAALGYPLTYMIDVLSFLVSLVSLAAIRRMPASDRASRPGIRSIVEGLKYALGRPELIGTYVVDMVAMTFAMPMALFPAMALAWGGATAAGWLYSAMSFGSLFTTIFSGWTSKVNRHGAAVVIAAAVWAVAIVFVGFASSLSVAVVCLAIAGAADSISGVFRSTIWNETIPSDLRGRLAGVEMISYLSGPLLGNARAGWVASISSNTISVVSGGLTCFVGVLLCIPLLSAFWNYRAERRAAAAVAVETR
ncbi:MAG: MFS transporter [Acidobacteria bacterium]|nr:MAG: MFS transporter [Acidobacteriota bacterium]